jgi:glycosyltransferase involved in cell wall biosynthesis
MLEEGAYLVDGARAMAGAIIALNIQPPFRETMVNQGLAQATKYHWRKTARKTLEVYEKVLKDGDSRSID